MSQEEWQTRLVKLGPGNVAPSLRETRICLRGRRTLTVPASSVAKELEHDSLIARAWSRSVLPSCDSA